jgi:hypothetical protein
MVLPECFAVCRLAPAAPIPPSCREAAFCTVTRTTDELSAILPESLLPPDCKSEKGWRCLKVVGPLDFSMTGVLASVVGPLAAAGISVLACSTYDTDYFLVREKDLQCARDVLTEKGHQVRNDIQPEPA